MLVGGLQRIVIVGALTLYDVRKRDQAWLADCLGADAIVIDVPDGNSFDRRWKFYTDIGFWRPGDPDNPRRLHIPMADVKTTLD